MMREQTCLINERALAARSPITTPPRLPCPNPARLTLLQTLLQSPTFFHAIFLTLGKPIMRDIFMHPSKEIKSKIPKVA